MPHYYEVVGKALLWSLEQGLGEDWTPSVADVLEQGLRASISTLHDHARGTAI